MNPNENSNPANLDDTRISQKNDSQKNCRISLQPRICAKIWENLRKEMRESFRMELEFFDYSHRDTVQNFWTESLRNFH